MTQKEKLLFEQKEVIIYESGIVSDIGRRSYMQDTYDLSPPTEESYKFGGVYDGHGAGFASEYAKNELHEVFFDRLSKGDTSEQAFTRAYEDVSWELEKRALSESLGGTTAVNFYIKDGIIYYANAGDARLIVVSETGVVQLTRDHRLSNNEERRRILTYSDKVGIANGIYVYKGDRGLMPTRSLGDSFFKDVGIIATPEVGSYKLSKSDQWVLAATDGLFDVMTNDEIAKFLRDFQNAEEAAEGLKVETLLYRRCRDNLTFILLKLQM